MFPFLEKKSHKMQSRFPYYHYFIPILSHQITFFHETRVGQCILQVLRRFVNIGIHVFFQTFAQRFMLPVYTFSIYKLVSNFLKGLFIYYVRKIVGGFRQMLIIAYILGGWVWTYSYVRFLYMKRTENLKNLPPIHQKLSHKMSLLLIMTIFLAFSIPISFLN